MQHHWTYRSKHRKQQQRNHPPAGIFLSSSHRSRLHTRITSIAWILQGTYLQRHQERWCWCTRTWDVHSFVTNEQCSNAQSKAGTTKTPWSKWPTVSSFAGNDEEALWLPWLVGISPFNNDTSLVTISSIRWYFFGWNQTSSYHSEIKLTWQSQLID